MITALQNEFNQLMFLQFTAIGVIQRDYDKPELKTEIIPELAKNIKECKNKIEKMLDEIKENEEYVNDVEIDFKNYKNFYDDWINFIDTI